jgi:hypothetical protein
LKDTFVEQELSSDSASVQRSEHRRLNKPTRLKRRRFRDLSGAACIASERRPETSLEHEIGRPPINAAVDRGAQIGEICESLTRDKRCQRQRQDATSLSLRTIS